MCFFGKKKYVAVSEPSAEWPELPQVFCSLVGSLSIRRLRRLRKHHLKSEVALPQTSLHLFHLV